MIINNNIREYTAIGDQQISNSAVVTQQIIVYAKCSNLLGGLQLTMFLFALFFISKRSVVLPNVQILNIKIITMSITKGAQDEDNSLFPQNLLINEVPSPCNSFQQRKTSPSPKHHEDQSPHDFQPIKSNIGPSQLRFYQEYKKIYTVSHHLSLEKTRQLIIIDSLSKRIRSLQEKMRDINQKMIPKTDQISDQNRIKRSRRTAEEIQKKYKCEVTFCERLYGSEGSLQQHIKLKHPELYHKSHSQDSIMPHNQDSLL